MIECNGWCRYDASQKRITNQRVCLMVVLFGGNSNNGSIGGLGSSNSNNDWSNSNTNYGARLDIGGKYMAETIAQAYPISNHLAE